jgi:TetR/AcrR family transcriptional regulator
MTTRAQQGIETRERILDAAIQAFSENGFRGASTRDIAKRADTNQGLITYHFRTKGELWRAAAGRIFESFDKTLAEEMTRVSSGDARELTREAIRIYVRFAAHHPELFRFMVDEGNNEDHRMEWLVDTHLRPKFDEFVRSRVESEGGDVDLPHVFYAMVGAASLIFAVAPECQRLTGLDPNTASAIENHAEYLARTLVP